MTSRKQASKRPPRHWIGVEKGWESRGGHPFDHLVTLDAYRLATHGLIIGATGSGKTNLIHHVVAGEALARRSMVVLDMRGDLAAAVLRILAAAGTDSRLVEAIDLRERDRPTGWNPLGGEGESYFAALGVLDAIEADTIDWSRHEVYLSQGKGSIAVSEGKGLVASISPELTNLLRLFNEHRIRHNLDLTYLVNHHTDEPSVDVSRELGLGVSAPLRYAGDKLEIPFSTGDLGELGAAYNRYGASEPARKPSSSSHGTVVHVGDHYGFLRPDGQHEGRDYWFLLKSWPEARCRVGAKANFLSELDHRGRRVASSISPDGADRGNRW